MKRLRNHLIGIDQGDLVLFQAFEDGGDMWTGDGARAVTRSVTFSESFHSDPSVTVWLSMWDMANGANNRADVRAENITKTGFDVNFRTWGDTKVARVRVGWQALGEMRHADEWDLY